MKTKHILILLLLIINLPLVLAQEEARWSVENVPNPKVKDVHNYVSNPDGILSESSVDKINNLLVQLEDSLTIEVAVVALQSIGNENPDDFAFRLFSHWGVGKQADDNGLLILLTLDQREITFKTGYGLEGVLPDATCHRIQQDVMLPYLKNDDFDGGMTEGIQAVRARLYGSDYTAALTQYSLENLLDEIPDTARIITLCVLFLVNLLALSTLVKKHNPQKLKTTQEAIQAVTLSGGWPSTTGILKGFYILPLWPAMILFFLWHIGFQRQQVRKKARTCPHCGGQSLKIIPAGELDALLSPAEQMEKKIGSGIYNVYHCMSCGENLGQVIHIDNGYKCCPSCQNLTLKPIKPETNVEEPTYTSKGLSSQDHQCVFCGASYAVQDIIPKLRRSDSGGSSSGGGSSSSGGGSFGGGSSGGGGSSSRF